MSTAQATIKAATSSLHSRYLKGLGFRKSGSTWARASKWTEVINIQLSKWNTSEDATLTLNFGIYIEALHEASGGLPFKGSVKEYNCDVRSRIGALHEDKKDFWLAVSTSTNGDELADSLYSEIRDFGLPWFERLGTFESVAREFLGQKNPFKAAIAYHLEGMAHESGMCMSQALADSNEQTRSRTMRIANALKIPTHC